MQNINVVMLGVIIANVLFSMAGFNKPDFFEKYKFNIASIKNGEKLRMFTSGFLHADITHLLFNMYTLYMFAPILIKYLGGTSFLLVYLASLLLGSVFSFYFHKNEPYYSAIGASGAVSGVLYSSILLYPDMSLYLFFIPIPIPSYVFGIGYLLYSIYGMKKQHGNIGHDAHFGGAVGGYVLTLLLVPNLLQTNILMVVLLAIPIVLLYFLHKMGKI